MGQAPGIELILASASPRRLELLQNIGLNFKVMPSDIAEESWQGGIPAAYARNLAQAKAMATAAVAPHAIVIGADTIVVCKGTVLGKPQDTNDAARMLKCLSGQQHEVITGVAVVAGSGPRSGQILISHEQTVVEFRTLSDNEISAYIRTGEPQDKAGAYGIQGMASLFVKRIVGCYSNVVGLPIHLLGRLLTECGVPLWADEARVK